MPPEPHRPPELEWQVFRGSDAVRRGHLTEHQLRSRAWRRLAPDVYADARLADTHALLCQGVALRLPKGAVVGGPSAAVLHGVEFAGTARDPVHVIAPPGIRVSPQRALRVHVTDVPDSDLVVAGDPPHTTAARAAWDAAAWLSPEIAVAIADAMLNMQLLTEDDLDHQIDARVGRRGSRRAREALIMADGRTKDPRESALRVRLLRAGMPRPVLGHPVVFGSGYRLEADMAWPEFKVCIEYTTHRLALLTAAGWLAIHVPHARTRRDFATVLREVRQAIIRRDPRMAERWPR